MAVANPIIVARKDRALNAGRTVTRIEGELDDARKARARLFAAWHDAGASYGAMAKEAELSRSTVIELVKWGRALADDNETTHPRVQRQQRSDTDA